jgi:hypothetical protein
MCCGTHPLRDEMDRQAGVEFQLAEREDFRCRCPHFGSPCDRRMDGEDFLCEWCRVMGPEGHRKWCFENESVGGYGYVDSSINFTFDAVAFTRTARLDIVNYAAEVNEFRFREGGPL